MSPPMPVDEQGFPIDPAAITDAARLASLIARMNQPHSQIPNWEELLVAVVEIRERQSQRKWARIRLMNEQMDREPDRKQRPGYVYFIATREGDRVKIGWSSDPRRRLRELQSAFAEPLLLLGLVAGSRSLERQLHHRFATTRMRGEWFLNSPQLQQFICEESHRQHDVLDMERAA